MICTLSGIDGAPSVAISFANNTIFLDRGESKGTYVETSRGDARAPRPVWAWELIAGPRIILKDLTHPGALIELIPGEKPDSLGISYMPAVAIRDAVIVAQGNVARQCLWAKSLRLLRQLTRVKIHEEKLIFTPYLIGRLVLPQPDVNRVTKQIFDCPGQIGDLRDQLGLDPVDSRQNKRGAEAR
jgi:hypothetical protein